MILKIQKLKVQIDENRNMNISHDLKWSSLVAPMMLFIVMGATRPVNAEQPLTIEVSRCVDMKSAIERLTCYDELAYQAQQANSELEAADLSERESDSGSGAPVATVEQERVAATAVIQRTPVVEQVPVTDQTVNEAGRVTEENFGLPPEKKDDEKDLVELQSTISKLKETVPGRYLITLENGQVWRQMVGERYQLRVGQNVRIYPTHWGKSFRLSAEGVKGYIQVERVR
jgi:hypothetical protein